MNKRKIIGLAATALMSVSLAGTVNTVNTDYVQAAKISAVKASQKSKLTHNAYIYDNKGKRVKNTKTLKKGKTIKILGIKTIKGKNYARIGKNKYVKVANLDIQKKTKITHNSYIYNSKGKRVGKKTLKKNTTIAYMGIVTIKGKKYIQIADNQFIKLANVAAGNSKKVSADKDKIENKKPEVKDTDNSSDNIKEVVKIIYVPTPVSDNSTAEDNNQSTKDNEYDENLKEAKQDTFVYDAEGNRVPGKIVQKGWQISYRKKNPLKINGKTYYKMYDAEDMEGLYIPAEAFEDSDKSLIDATPASDDEFLAIKKELRDYQRITSDYKYSFSDKNTKEAYDTVLREAESIADLKYSTSQDIKDALANLEKAKDNLNGAPVEVTLTYGEKNLKLTNEQKDQILALANKVWDTTDARFSSDGTQVVGTNGVNFLSAGVHNFIHITYVPKKAAQPEQTDQTAESEQLVEKGKD